MDTGAADPETFGIFDMHGLWFIRGDLVRDLLSLNRVEILPWDHWGVMAKEDKDLLADDWTLLDGAAALCQGGNAAFDEVRSIYESTPGIQIPTGWMP